MNTTGEEFENLIDKEVQIAKWSAASARCQGCLLRGDAPLFPGGRSVAQGFVPGLSAQW